MRIIESFEQARKQLIQERTRDAAKNLLPSVRPIFAGTKNGRLEMVGSSILLLVGGVRFVVTAAHILDNRKNTNLYIGGRAGARPALISADWNWKGTPAPNGVRRLDKIDCAFSQVPESIVRTLGAVEFLEPDRISHNRAPLANRVYMAMGYPLSRNRTLFDFRNRSISSNSWTYCTQAVNLPQLAAELGTIGNEHIFVGYGKYSRNEHGNRAN
jgi:hypothetical protein